jgi:hypothetical protein
VLRLEVGSPVDGLVSFRHTTSTACWAVQVLNSVGHPPSPTITYVSILTLPASLRPSPSLPVSLSFTVIKFDVPRRYLVYCVPTYTFTLSLLNVLLYCHYTHTFTSVFPILAHSHSQLCFSFTLSRLRQGLFPSLDSGISLGRSEGDRVWVFVNRRVIGGAGAKKVRAVLTTAFRARGGVRLCCALVEQSTAHCV